MISKRNEYLKCIEESVYYIQVNAAAKALNKDKFAVWDILIV
jgi:hypothetical protein